LQQRKTTGMATFQHSSIIPASTEELFRFHENPENLRAISPPGLKILEISAAPRARIGEDFHVAVQQGPVTLRWTGRWENVEAPTRLVDTAVRSPFRYWRHEHLFAPGEGGSRLTDRVEFRLPWFLGGLIGDLFVRLIIFPVMFAARHRATHTYFTYQNTKSTGAPSAPVPSSPRL
jgi:ligand-binding SRPBCC domain-containing protein